jgi:hypothetical protein
MNGGWLSAHPVQLSGEAHDVPGVGGAGAASGETEYSDDEQKVLEDRLRSLGYIE